MTARAAVRRLHLALALGLGAIGALLGASGAMLVFRGDLEGVALPPLPPGESRAEGVSLQALVDAARRVHPALTPSILILPDADGRPARVTMRGHPGEEPEVLVDPRSGQVLGARWRERSALHALALLHAELYLGARGRVVVGLLGLGFLLQAVSGLYLWWPFTRRPARGFRVRWSRPWSVVGYDVHKAVGAASLALNLPLALTGMLLGLAALWPGAEWPPVDGAAVQRPAARAAGAADVAVPLDVIARQAGAALPGRLASITLPAPGLEGTDPRGRSGAFAYVRKQLPGEMDRRGTGLVIVEPSTGEVVRVVGGRGTPVSARLRGMVAPLHYGDFGGGAIKLLYAAAGLTMPVLVLTGYAVWLARMRRSARLPSLTDHG